MSLVVQAAPELTGPNQQQWLDQLQAEAGNLHAALAWSLSVGQSQAALRLASALWRFWWVRGFLSDGRRMLSEALALAGEVPTAERAAALFGAGMLAWAQGEATAARAIFEQCLPLRRMLGSRGEIAETLNGLALTLHAAGEDAAAQSAYEESLRLYRAVDDRWGSANPLAGIATIARARGEWQRAVELLAESLQLRRERGDQHGSARSLYDIGVVQLRLGDRASAYAALSESMRLYGAIGNHGGLASVLVALAWLHSTRGRINTAADLVGAAYRLRASTGSAPVDAAEDARLLADVRTGVGEPMMLAAIADSRHRPLDEVLHAVLRLALDVEREPQPPG
jgi:tetratricopeptide (TPR) repeat protein